MKPESFSPVAVFRERVYSQFSQRADALFEMLDALLALPSATAPAHMMLLPGFQRSWGSIYDALASGRINASGVEDLVAQFPLDGGESVYAVDSSIWSRCDAETSPNRGSYHHHNHHSAGKPIVAGWSYQWLAQVSFRHDSWCAPLSAQRVEPTDNMQQVAATQIRALLQRRPDKGEVPIFVFDAGYDAIQLAQLLDESPIALLVRLKSNRCFYAKPAEGQTGGHPRWHGDKFMFREAQTWWDPQSEYLIDDIHYGQVHIQSWPVLLAYTMMRLARPLVADQRLPWERSLQADKLTPYRVRRTLSVLLPSLPHITNPPKPCGRSPGRRRGVKSEPAPRYPAIKKSA